METQTQTTTATKPDMPATKQDLTSLFETFNKKLDRAVEKIIEDQETHAARLREHDEVIDETKKRVEEIERELGLDDTPWYLDGGFWKDVGITAGIALVVGGGSAYVVNRVSRKKEEPSEDGAGIQVEGEPESFDLD